MEQKDEMFSQTTYLFRVIGVDGKYAALWAINKSEAKQRFESEFYPGFQAKSA